MLKVFTLLDFDGVLFDSVPEVYQVCSKVAENYHDDYSIVSFDEFKEFRSRLTDAWQFNRLLSRSQKIDDFSKLEDCQPNEFDWEFTDRFFKVRSLLMEDPDWPQIMRPYNFFHKVKSLITANPDNFCILSTRNEASILRTLKYHNMDGVSVYGQDAVRKHGSKLAVVKNMELLPNEHFTIYLDDMSSHLLPFANCVHLCLQADWGYDNSDLSALNEDQAFHILSSFHKSIDQPTRTE